MTTSSITIDLSAPERDALLTHVPLPVNIVARLRFAIHTVKGLELVLTGDDAMDFGEAVEEHLPRIKNRADARLVEEVFRRFVAKIEDLVEDEIEELEFPPEMPEDIQKSIRDILQSEEFANTEEAMAAVDKLVAAHNAQPLKHLLGLSPEQGIRLFHADWSDEDSPVKLNADLSEAELTGSYTCHSAMRFLALADEAGGFTITSHKNLNRSAVKVLLDGDCFPEVKRADLERHRQVLNEQDCMPLHILRLLLVSAKLARLFKGKFVLTKLGKQVLERRQFGRVQILLFEAMFRRFNLAYIDRLPDYDGVQSTINFILYVVYTLAREPISVEELAAKAYLPIVSEDFFASPYMRHDLVALRWRVLGPLSGFGLIALGEDDRGPDFDRTQVQATPLFSRMLRYEF